MEIELKPCPFCESASLRVASQDHDGRHGEETIWWIECNECSGVGPTLPSRYEATEAWNRSIARAEAAEQRAAAAEQLSDRYGVFIQECGFLADIEVYSPDDLPSISERLGAFRARAEAAEKRAEALAAEVARLRADALVLVGLARTAAIYDLNGPDTEAWGEALLLADGLSSADVAEVMRRVLRGVAESQPAEVSDV